jgi:hypothetical protein
MGDKLKSKRVGNFHALRDTIWQAKKGLQAEAKSVQSSVDVALQNAVGDLNRKVDDAVLYLVPVGTILPYYGKLSALPDSWTLCDGKTIRDRDSDFFNISIPDLDGFFIRGTESYSELGLSGGRDKAGYHTHSIDSHDHYIGSHSHPFNTDDYTENSHRSWNVTLYRDGIYWVLSGKSEADLNHSHPGTTDSKNLGRTGSESLKTDEYDGHDNRPRFRSFYYIIRIK